MRHSEADHFVACDCRSVGECDHNTFAWRKALDAAVDDFAEQMKCKLAKKFLEGKSGWDDPEWSMEDKLRQLREHIDRGDMIDVANFAMFAWNQAGD